MITRHESLECISLKENETTILHPSQLSLACISRAFISFHTASEKKENKSKIFSGGVGRSSLLISSGGGDF